MHLRLELNYNYGDVLYQYLPRYITVVFATGSRGGKTMSLNIRRYILLNSSAEGVVVWRGRRLIR